MRSLMESLRYFYRGTWQDYLFPLFSPVHFLLLAILITGGILIAVNKEKLRSDGRRILGKLFLGSLFLEQISQYSWYFLAGTFTLGDGLPLYICRTAIPAIILAYLTGNYFVMTISVYWGLFGGILALLFPVIYPFYFPHITNFTYFLGHFVMVWSVIYFLAVEKYRFTTKGLLSALVFTNLFNVFVHWLNPMVNGNYSYFSYPPVFKEVLGKLSSTNYAVVVFITYNLLILLIHGVGAKLQTNSRPTQGQRQTEKW
ncbi:MAG: TIGR02206 family membrane protein [Clostridiaceae bacterium]